MTAPTSDLALADPFAPFRDAGPEATLALPSTVAVQTVPMDPYDPFGNFGQDRPDEVQREGWRADLLARMLTGWTTTDLQNFLAPLGGLDATDGRGQTVLMGLAHHRNDPAPPGEPFWLDRLLAKGASINQRTPDGHSALSIALSRGHPGIAMRLLRLGGDARQDGIPGMPHLDPERTATGGRGPLLPLALPFPPVVRALLLAGANPNQPTERGQTPLHQALLDGLNSVVLTLLGAGAQVPPLLDGETPLTLGLPRLNGMAIRALVRAGANPSAPNVDGITPLDRASRTSTQFEHDRRVRRVQLLALLDAGADPHRPLRVPAVAAGPGRTTTTLIARLLNEEPSVIDWSVIQDLVRHRGVSLDVPDPQPDHLGSRTLWERVVHLERKVPPEGQNAYRVTREFVELHRLMDGPDHNGPRPSRERVRM